MGSFVLNTKFLQKKKTVLKTICYEIFQKIRKHIIYHYQSTPACLSGLHTTVEFVFYIFHHQTYPSLLLPHPPHLLPHPPHLLPHPPHLHLYLLSTQKVTVSVFESEPLSKDDITQFTREPLKPKSDK